MPRFETNSREKHGHTTPLSEIIFQSLAEKVNPKLRFDKFMELALYHPQHGYYSSPIGKKIGRGGDFFTSVAVGDTFGLLLSHAIEQKWRQICPDFDKPLIIVEQGAHDGQLARDILDGFASRNSPLRKNIEYRIVEPRESVRREISEDPECTRYTSELYLVQSLEEARSDAGIFLSNELLDAFPVRRFVRRGDKWKEIYVIPDASENELVEREFDLEDADRFLELIGDRSHFDEGYTTEYCPGIKDWVEDCSQLFTDKGAWMMIDYGFEADEYFSPTRRTGTLQCYREHRKHDDALDYPGDTDITSHVNFTDVIHHAEKSGLTFAGLTDQSKFLTRAGEDWLRSLDGQVPDADTAAWLRQFQTLTHPALMGRSFRVLEFEK